MAAPKYADDELEGEMAKMMVNVGDSLGLVHDLPGHENVSSRLLALIMRFRMFKDGEVVGEVEKTAICSRVRDRKYEYSADLDGYEFDSLEVIVKDVAGNEIHRRTYKVSAGAGQSVAYRLLVVVE